jgi:drug/metabolite transporter (DMT)-like permease
MRPKGITPPVTSQTVQPGGTEQPPVSRLLSHVRDWTLLVVCNLIWASQFVLAKLVQQDMGPVTATFLPMALATLLLVPIVQYRRHRYGAGTKVDRGDVLRFAVIGVVGQVVAQLGITWGVRYAPASNAALLSLTLPIATAIMAYLLLGEHMTKVRWLSFALAVAGVLQCSGIEWGTLSFSSSTMLAGNILILAGVLGSAFYNVYSKKLLKRYQPLEVLLCSYYAVLVCLLPINLYTEPESLHHVHAFGPMVWLGLLLLAILQYFLSMVLFLTVLTRLDAVQAGMSNYLIPVFGVFIAAAVLGESLTPRMIGGGLVVLVSTLLITVYEEHRSSRSATQLATSAGERQ